MLIRPLRDQVVVRVAAEKEESKGGIILTATTKEKPSEGEVISVGPLIKDVKKGDHVLYCKFAGYEITTDTGDFLMLKEEDILGVITKKEIKSGR